MLWRNYLSVIFSIFPYHEDSVFMTSFLFTKSKQVTPHFSMIQGGAILADWSPSAIGVEMLVCASYCKHWKQQVNTQSTRAQKRIQR